MTVITSQQTQDDIVKMQEFSQLLPSLPQKFCGGSQPRRQIHRVPEQLRLKGQESNPLYEPVLVSLGPYHHGEPKLCQAEEFKLVCLDWCALKKQDKKMVFYYKILAVIGEIRGCYADTSTLEKYDDKKLALMMLLDACFIINFMDNLVNIEAASNNFSEWRNFLGVATAIKFAARDIVLLENQVPFKVLELIISCMYGKEEGGSLLQGLMSWMLSIELSQATIPNKDDDPPLHLLEACWRVIVGENNVSKTNQHQHVIVTQRKIEESSEPSCPSVIELGVMGILISPRPSHSLTDVRFQSYALSGLLELPIFNISEQTQVILTNLIAYEISPGSKADLSVLSYTKFMKSLIEIPADVKMLYAKGILRKGSASPEQVVEVFKNIDTFGVVKYDIFKDTKHKIEVHCRSKDTMYWARFRHMYLSEYNPWTVMGFVMSYAALLFTALQAMYVMREYHHNFPTDKYM